MPRAAKVRNVLDEVAPVGETRELRIDRLWVEVTILGRKRGLYGHILCEVTPVSGRGKRWVEEGRLRVPKVR